MRGERLHSKRFGGVMATVKNVHSQLFTECVSPVRPLAGDQRVHTFLRGSLYFSACATRHHADSPALFWPAGDHFHFATDGAFQVTA